MGHETNEETITQLNLTCTLVNRPFLRQICVFVKDYVRDCGQLEREKVVLVTEHLTDPRI